MISTWTLVRLWWWVELSPGYVLTIKSWLSPYPYYSRLQENLCGLRRSLDQQLKRSLIWIRKPLTRLPCLADLLTILVNLADSRSFDSCRFCWVLPVGLQLIGPVFWRNHLPGNLLIVTSYNLIFRWQLMNFSHRTWSRWSLEAQNFLTISSTLGTSKC